MENKGVFLLYINGLKQFGTTVNIMEQRLKISASLVEKY